MKWVKRLWKGKPSKKQTRFDPHLEPKESAPITRISPNFKPIPSSQYMMSVITQSSSAESVGSVTWKLTLKQLEECLDIFSVFEYNDMVDVKHLGPMIKALGHHKIPEEDIKMMQRKACGRLDFAYFVELVSPLIVKAHQIYSLERIDKAFTRFDKDSNGFISASELRTLLLEEFCTDIKGVAEELTDDDVCEILAEADLDGDGRINYNEFKEFIPHLSDCIHNVTKIRYS